MTEALVGSLASEASSLISTGLNNWFNRRANQEAREYGQRMAEYAYQMDLEQWNRANEYNSPKNQMQRLREAGLNPMLMYPMGNPGNAVQTAPKMSVPQGRFGGYDFTRRSNLIGDYLDLKMKGQQIDNLRSLKEKLDEETKIKKDEAIIKGLEAGLKPNQVQFLLEEMGYKKSLWPAQKDALDLKNQKTQADINRIIANTDLTNAQKTMLTEKINMWINSGLNMDKVPWWLQYGYKKYMEGKMSWDEVEKQNNEYLRRQGSGPGPVTFEE